MLPLSLLFISCTTTPVSDSSPLYWQGWVYEDIPSDETLGLEEGSLTMTSLDDGTVIEGEQGDASRLGYWTFEIEADKEVQIRIDGPEHYSTVWRTRTPHKNAFWYSGSIFAVRTATFDLFLESLAELTDEPLPDSQSDSVIVYGEPLYLSEADEAAWTNASITVIDSTGRTHEAITLTLDVETGGLVTPGPEPKPVAAFTASNIAPGPVALVVDASDGRSTLVEYEAEAGDLLSAFAFTLPWENQ